MLITRSRLPIALATGLAVLALLVAASFALGAFPLAPREALSVLWSALTGAQDAGSDSARAVVLELRAPRIAAALAVGMALGIAGAAFQTAFRNPLVSPDILGVSSGCALGAMAGFLLGLPAVGIQAAAFAGGLAAVTLVLAIGARIRAADPVLTLVLTGVVVGSLFSAGIAFAKTIADPYNQLAPMTFWLLGSFSGVLGRDLVLALPLMLLGSLPLVLLRWRVNVLALPEDEARALGVDSGRLRLLVVVAATLATSAAVALVGVIGWVGLVVPHAARLLTGPAFARVLPLAALLGAAFMLLVDTVCRTLAAAEVPPGVVTALVGTPAFIALLAIAGRRTA
ncbi:MAG TPA: iron ABC transporter permease [Usitatibacter sp.]|nr:iron ABC transporter permease [Usitatibacter sp.]